MEKSVSLNKMPLDNIFIIAANCLLTIVLVYIFFDLQIKSNDHPLYNSESILIIFFFSSFCFCQNNAYEDGEWLKFRIHYGLITA